MWVLNPIESINGSWIITKLLYNVMDNQQSFNGVVHLMDVVARKITKGGEPTLQATKSILDCNSQLGEYDIPCLSVGCLQRIICQVIVSKRADSGTVVDGCDNTTRSI